MIVLFAFVSVNHMSIRRRSNDLPLKQIYMFLLNALMNIVHEVLHETSFLISDGSFERFYTIDEKHKRKKTFYTYTYVT